VYELNKPEDKKAAKREDYKRWVQENRAYNTARHKKWSEENRPARLAMRARTDGKRRAQKMKTEVKDCPMVAALYTMARILTNTCEPMHVDHIYPLSKGGAHTFDNLQILTARDNLAKGNKI
jgi:5-methylcytosine-specific restriction endonuclease McrA